MKDEIDESAERLLGDTLNLEIDLQADSEILDSERGLRRHELVTEFFAIEYPELAMTRLRAEDLARLLCARLAELQMGALEPSRWLVEDAEKRTTTVANFVRERIRLKQNGS